MSQEQKVVKKPKIGEVSLQICQNFLKENQANFIQPECPFNYCQCFIESPCPPNNRQCYTKAYSLFRKSASDE